MATQRWDDEGVELGAAAHRRSLARAVFRTRHIGLIVLAVAAAAVPAIGPNRWLVAGCVIALTLPYDIVLDRVSRSTGRLPRALPLGDQAFAGAFVAMAPTVWVPVVVMLVCDVSLCAATLGRRFALWTLPTGALALAAGALAGDVQDPIVGVLAYLIGGGIIALNVGRLFDDERALIDRHDQLLVDVDAIVWEAVPEPCRYTFVSQRAEEILGHPVEAWYEPGFWHDHLHPDDRERVLDEDGAAIDARLDHVLEYRMVRADGGIVHLRDLVTVVTDGAGKVVSLRGLMVDITEQRNAEARVRQYADMVERIQMALVLARLDDPADPDSLRIVAANPSACALARRDVAHVIGRRAVRVFPGIGTDGSDLTSTLADVVRTGKAFDIDNVVNDATGVEQHFALHAFKVGEDMVGVSIDDVTSPRLAAEALRRQATHDALTGLPNRTLLNDRLEQSLRAAHRSGERVALLLMDLDQFKEINDALGHHHGDRLLVELSRRLEHVLRDADTIARLGGDEFAILLTTDATRAGAVTVARKITAALEQPFEVDGLSLQTNASIGIALHPDHGADAESLAKRADIAMYTAKRSTSPYSVYAPEHDRSSVRRLTLLGELRRAIDLRELELHHQPSFDVAGGHVVGTEALLRWNHPQHGLMLPGEFIDLAEVSGVIQQVTRYVTQAAIEAAASWPAGRAPLRVAVNLSVRNLYDQELCRWVERLLRETGFAADRLTFELTEREVMDDPLLAVEVLGELQQLGVHTSIDDFGTGQSSLAYLKHLPIDELKIDRSFVSGMVGSPSDRTIVRSIIGLGHDLGMSIVAEGVEDAATLELLREMGCDHAQGFHLGRPMPAGALAEVLRGIAGHDVSGLEALH